MSGLSKIAGEVPEGASMSRGEALVRRLFVEAEQGTHRQRHAAIDKLLAMGLTVQHIGPRTLTVTFVRDPSIGVAKPQTTVVDEDD